MERVTGLEPVSTAWHAAILALDDTRKKIGAECENRTHVWSLEDSGPPTGRIPLGSGRRNRTDPRRGL